MLTLVWATGGVNQVTGEKVPPWLPDAGEVWGLPGGENGECGGGGHVLGEADGLDEARRLAEAWAVIAPAIYGEGELVILTESGRRVNCPADLRPVSAGFTYGK